MRIRLYMDEDTMDHDLVAALRSRNVDVTTAEEMENWVEFLSAWD